MRRRDFLIAVTGFVLAPGAAIGNSEWIDRWWNDTDVHDEPPPDAINPRPSDVIENNFCDGYLRLKSAVHGECQDFRFRDKAGRYDAEVLHRLNWFLRCRDGSWQQMDIKMLETLNYVSALLGVPQVQVNSGYRSPAYNARLALTNENVARNSLHQYGQAIDFSIPGIPVRDVCSYALYARNVIGNGGIGYYPRAGFVHLDSGSTKQWAKI